MPPTKADIITKVHEAQNETLESGALSDQVATFIQDQKTASAEQIQTLKDALASAQAGTLTEEEATDANAALDGIIDGNNTLQRVLTAAITPAAEPLPPDTGAGDGTDGTSTVARSAKRR